MAGVIKEHSNMMPERGTGQAGWEVKGGCDLGTLDRIESEVFTRRPSSRIFSRPGALRWHPLCMQEKLCRAAGLQNGSGWMGRFPPVEATLGGGHGRSKVLAGSPSGVCRESPGMWLDG